jgi:hypothetical protein
MAGACHTEADGYRIEEGRFGKCQPRLPEILAGGKNQFVFAGAEGIALEQRLVAAAVRIGNGGGEFGAALAFDAVERHRQVRGGFAQRRIEHMRGQPAGTGIRHDLSSP